MAASGRPTFLEPFWVRAAIVAAAAGWALFEYAQGATYWALFFVAVALYAFWSLILAYRR